MFVEIVDYPAKQLDVLLLVTKTNDALIAAIYSENGERDDYGEMPSAVDALQMIASNNAPEFVKAKEKAFIRQVVVPHGTNSLIGYDELVDYSVLDLYKDGVAWEPRLATTKQTKIIYSARVRDLQRRRLLASLYVRFNTGDLSETVVHLVNRGDCLVTDLVADHRFDGTTVPVGPGGAKWLDYFWHADVQLAGRSDQGHLLFDVELKNNKDGSPCHQKTRLEITTDSGYLPKRLVTTDDQGRAQFYLIPLGLSSGEKVKVKLSATHFTNVGGTTAEV
jgi:hypothetical protein